MGTFYPTSFPTILPDGRHQLAERGMLRSLGKLEGTSTSREACVAIRMESTYVTYDPSRLSTSRLLQDRSGVMREPRIRDVIRTNNHPVGDMMLGPEPSSRRPRYHSSPRVITVYPGALAPTTTGVATSYVLQSIAAGNRPGALLRTMRQTPREHGGFSGTLAESSIISRKNVSRRLINATSD